MPAELIFDRMASREYLKARRWFAARAAERIAEVPDPNGTVEW